MTTVQRRQRVVELLMERHGKTFAEEAGIRLKDEPAALYRLLVLCILLAAPVASATGVRAARSLASGGLRTARAMRDSEWHRRVELLGEAGYRRFDERTATVLGEGADLVLQRWSGDLRRLREDASDAESVRRLLQEVPGVGPVASAIFCREAQGVWPLLFPFTDERVQDGARRLGLPSSPRAIVDLVAAHDFPGLAAACVRVTLDRDLEASIQEEVEDP